MFYEDFSKLKKFLESYKEIKSFISINSYEANANKIEKTIWINVYIPESLLFDDSNKYNLEFISSFEERNKDELFINNIISHWNCSEFYNVSDETVEELKKKYNICKTTSYIDYPSDILIKVRNAINKVKMMRIFLYISEKDFISDCVLLKNVNHRFSKITEINFSL